MKIIEFENKDRMHAIGLGTWKASGNEVKDAVKKAVKAGFRHIDTAAVYGNEVEIGEALAELFEEGVVHREDIFITSKLWNDSHQKAYVIPALQDSLKKLQLTYLDLYLIHWPVAFKPGVQMPTGESDYLSLEEVPTWETWEALVDAKKQAFTRHIGVSNFSKKKLKKLIEKTSVIPEMNQVEMHPLLQQNDLLDYCNSEGIKLTAYSPLGSGDRTSAMKGENEPNLMDIPEIKAIAKKRGASAAQVLIAWHTHRNTAVIPKSTSETHIIANFKAADVVLDEKDMASIATLDRNYRFITGKFFDAPSRGYTDVYDEA